jgi:hypothetical protein
MIGEFIGRVPDLPLLREQFKLACGLAYVMITWFVSRSTGIAFPVFLLVIIRYFWYFWLTIQNTANWHVSNAFDLLSVFISFPLARCAPYPTPPPFFWGRESTKKENLGRGRGGGVVLFCWRVLVC